ncbi:DUF4145 domain-containing protein [Ensifer sp. ENS05]|uniref:DUF4145 domain-containing protein n=1 Tax=Ensifer sp. ENS05 TaxID=2769277 RepID=UPI001784220F|nr:DUF4145 domain-containing protein [Ensifer sp. ENS05]MBD9592697.1 DUF4145 domain-containing protein [Ensifer sp. ENS05]
MTIFPKGGRKGQDSKDLSIRCPSCRQIGMFYGMYGIPDLGWYEPVPNEHNAGFPAFAGIRICPNIKCNALVFVAINPEGSLITYPPETLDFDASQIPDPIVQSLQEAIRCHAASCYRASALMVRRVLEELCDDKEAKGKDLKARIANLSSVAIIPTELLAAADELRVLGNDAAHIEAKAYDQIGREECELAIELAKELLKAVYQYQSLVARLRTLKKTQLSSPQP